MSELPDFSNSKSGDAELQDFLMAEKQKAQFQAQVQRKTNLKKCLSTP